MQRMAWIAPFVLLLACSSETATRSSVTGSDASDADAARDVSECPCPGPHVCESGFCVRPAPDGGSVNDVATSDGSGTVTFDVSLTFSNP